MRKLKLRVWDAERKKMAYGQDSDSGVEDGAAICGVNRYFAGFSFGEVYVAYHDEGGIWTECEIMLSTGLLDRNGKEIYAGDILDMRYDEDEDHLYVPVSYDHGAFWAGNVLLFEDHDEVRGVVGNIYEHPHLLEPPC